MTIWRTRAAMLVLLAAIVLGPTCPAGAAQGLAALSADDKADISRIEAYLNRIKTMEARFLQVSSNGDYSEGDLYFSKPGKMRLEYDDPKPVLIVADGVNLAYFDKELEQVSYYDLEATQAAILLRDRISFSSGEVIVTSFERGPGVLRITVIKGDNPMEGNLTLIFSDNPLGLKKWTITDAQGIVTNVSLLGPRFGAPLDPDLFHVEEPDEAIKTK
ncbi:MAG: outer membrane lipoprotein carrier protein LolA [Rhodospirillales bacterium]